MISSIPNTNQESEIKTPVLEFAMDVHGTTETEVSFIFQDYQYEFTIHIPNKLIQATFRTKRHAIVPKGTPKDVWLGKYYQAMTADPKQNLFYELFLSEFEGIKKRRNLDDDEYVELLTAYVESLPYHYEKLVNPARHLYYPVETVSLGTGVCEDKALLLASLLSHAGYDSAYLLFEEDKHAMAGIRVPTGEGYQGCDYAPIETTRAGAWIGDPCGTISPVKIFPVGSGKKLYQSLPEMKRLLHLRDEIYQQCFSSGSLGRTLKVEKSKLVRLRKKISDQYDRIQEYKQMSESGQMSDKDFAAFQDLVSQYNNNLDTSTSMVNHINELVDVHRHLADVYDYSTKHPTNRKRILQLFTEAVARVPGDSVCQ